METLLQSTLEAIAFCLGIAFGFGIVYLGFIAYLFIKETTQYYYRKFKKL